MMMLLVVLLVSKKQQQPHSTFYIKLLLGVLRFLSLTLSVVRDTCLDVFPCSVDDDA